MTWGIVPTSLLAFRTFFWQVQQKNVSYSLPCKHKPNPTPAQDARWQRKVALLTLTGLAAFLWMSSRDLLFCRRNCWMLWFTLTMGPGTRKAQAFHSSSVLTHEHDVLWAENHPELPGKMLQLTLEICCSSGVVYVPQILQWPDSNSEGGLAPAQIVSLMGEGTGAAEPGWPGQWESQLWSEVGVREPAPACRTVTPLPLTSSWPSSQREAEIVLVSES